MAEEVVFFTSMDLPRLEAVGDGLWDDVVTGGTPNPAFDTGITRKAGTRGSLRSVVHGDYHSYRKNFNAGTRRALASGWWRFDDAGFTSGTRMVCFQVGTSTQHAEIQVADNGSGGLKWGAGIWDGAAFQGTVYGPTVTASTWHHVELWADFSANPWTLAWRIDGVLQTATSTAVAAADITKLIVANNIDSSLVIAGTGLVNFTDIIYVINPDTWRDNDQYVLSRYIDGTGTHNLDASTSAVFFKEVSAVRTAITSSDTTSHQTIDDVQIDADADLIVIKNAAAGSTKYVEYTVQDIPTDKTMLAMRPVTRVAEQTAGQTDMAGYFSSTGPSLCLLYSGTPNSTADEYTSTNNFVHLTDSLGGAWTPTKFNNGTVRLGFVNGTNSVELYVKGLVLEVLLSDPAAEKQSVYYRRAQTVVR